jgi:hypothetical protein
MSTASKTHATGGIDVKTYEPQPLRGSGRGADLVEIHVSETFSGDIVGEGVARFLQAVRKDRSGSFVGDVVGRDRRFDVRRSELRGRRPASPELDDPAGCVLWLARRSSLFELARVMGTSVRMIEKHCGTLLEGRPRRDRDPVGRDRGRARACRDSLA